MPKVACACGCGTLIAPINKNLIPARYAHGHNPDGAKYRFVKGDLEMPRRGAEGLRRAGKISGPGHANWRGGEWTVNGGYVRRTLTTDEAAWMPTACRHGNGWSLPRSHYVWNLAHPDDVVHRGDVVHHINRVRDDDRIENLSKMDRSVHHRMHLDERH